MKKKDLLISFLILIIILLIASLMILCIKNIKKFKPKKFKSNTGNMIELICNYIDNN